MIPKSRAAFTGGPVGTALWPKYAPPPSMYLSHCNRVGWQACLSYLFRDPGCTESDVVVINIEAGHRILPGTHAESKFLETADKVRIGC
jgi:hypothetical protein